MPVSRHLVHLKTFFRPFMISRLSPPVPWCLPQGFDYPPFPATHRLPPKARGLHDSNPARRVSDLLFTISKQTVSIAVTLLSPKPGRRVYCGDRASIFAERGENTLAQACPNATARKHNWAGRMNCFESSDRVHRTDTIEEPKAPCSSLSKRLASPILTLLRTVSRYD